MRKAFAIWLVAGLPVLADSVAATRSWVSNRVAEARSEWRGEVVAATNPVPSWISAAEGRTDGRLGSATNAVKGWIEASTNGLPEMIASATNGLPAEIAAVTNGLPAKIAAVTNGLPERMASVTNGLPERMAAVTNGLPEAIAGTTNGLPERIAAVTNGLPESVAAATNGVMEEVNAATGSLWTAIGNIEGVTADIGALARTNDLPTKVSQLENDAGYLTNHVDVSNLVRAAGVFPDWTSKGTWSEGEFCTWKGVVYRFTGAGDPSAQPDISPVSWAASDVGTAIAEARPDMSSLTNPIPSWIAAATGGVPARVSALVQSMVSGLDGKAATRLVSADGSRWIDGTGAVWQVGSVAEWNGGQVEGALGATNWTGEGWTLSYTAYTTVTGTWTLVRTLSDSGPLTVEYGGDGLVYDEGEIALQAKRALLDGVEVTPGQITANGWYQIEDGQGRQHFVSPLVTTVTVVRVTNAVDRLALASGEMTTNDVCAIVTNATGGGWSAWTVYRDGVDVTDRIKQPWYNPPPDDYDPEEYDWLAWGTPVVAEDQEYSTADGEHGDEDTDSLSWSGVDDQFVDHEYTATRRMLPVRNALGLARLEDVDSAIARMSLAGSPPFDFADMRGVYLSLSNIIHALGGSVTNFPAFEQ